MVPRAIERGTPRLGTSTSTKRGKAREDASALALIQRLVRYLCGQSSAFRFAMAFPQCIYVRIKLATWRRAGSFQGLKGPLGIN